MSPIPEVMRAAVVRELGSTSAIHIEQVPVPTPGPTDVLVRVLASEINHVDVFVVTGAYPTPTPFPFVVGRDLVGEIVAAGEGTGSLRVGERVWTNSLGYAGRQGALAEYALVPADRTYQLPAGADPLAAAAVLHTGATAATGLQHRARVGIGDTVLIGGGAGGVGSAAIRIASWAGARVVATARTEDTAWCTSLGAQQVLDYRQADLDERLHDAAPEGVDVFWDTSGHYDLAAATDLLAPRGTLLITAGLAAQAQLPVGSFYTRDLTVRGFAMSGLSADELAAAARTVNQLISADTPVARATEVVELDGVADAFERLRAGSVRARLLVRL